MGKPTDIEVAQKFMQLWTSAKDRGIKFELNLTSVRNLLSAERCYYTGKRLTQKSLSVDRLDNDKGYIKGNVVACHRKFNSKKGRLSRQEIIDLYNGVVMRRRKKRSQKGE